MTGADREYQRAESEARDMETLNYKSGEASQLIFKAYSAEIPLRRYQLKRAEDQKLHKSTTNDLTTTTMNEFTKRMLFPP